MKAFFLLAIPFLGYTAPVGNTASPEILQQGFFIPPECWINVRAGYEGDFVSDGKMRLESGASGLADSFSQTTNSGSLTLNFLHRLDIYGIFGASKVETSWRFLSLTDAMRAAYLQTRSTFLWATGARALLCSWGKCDLGFGGRYSRSDYAVDFLQIDGVPTSTVGSRAGWKGWQLNFDVSYRIDFLTPYLGVKYGKEKMQLYSFPVAIGENGSTSLDFVNDHTVGMYVGCAISNGKYFFLNVEGRFIDEEAVSVSGDFRF